MGGERSPRSDRRRVFAGTDKFLRFPGVDTMYREGGQVISVVSDDATYRPITGEGFTDRYPGSFSFFVVPDTGTDALDGGLIPAETVGAYNLVPPPQPPAVLPASPWTGFGLPVLSRALPLPSMENSTRALILEGGTAGAGLGTGESRLHCFEALSGAGSVADEEVSVTLVWTDHPAAHVATEAWLVNDLDLRLHAVDRWDDAFEHAEGEAPRLRRPAFTAHGNAEAGGDRRNNVEKVMVVGAGYRRWCAEVVAHAVPVGPQRYALVAAVRQPSTEQLTGVAGHEPTPARPDDLSDTIRQYWWAALAVVCCFLGAFVHARLKKPPSDMPSATQREGVTVINSLAASMPVASGV